MVMVMKGGLCPTFVLRVSLKSMVSLLTFLHPCIFKKIQALTIEDINHLSKAFWALHTDPLLCIDSSATTLLTIQYNLVVGTIAPFAEARPELRPLLQDLVDFKILFATSSCSSIVY